MWLGRILKAVAAALVALGATAAAEDEPGAAHEPPARRIALTYDDAPRSEGLAMSISDRTEGLSGGLRDRGVVAAFFVTTRGMQQQKDGAARLQRFAADGHLLANHTHTHPWAHKTKVADYLADIDTAEARLEGLPNRRAWFRYPYLDEGRTPEKVAALSAGLADRGLMNGYVTIDNYDWHIDQRLQQALKAGRTVDYDKLGHLYTDMLLDAARFFDDAAVAALGRSPVHVLLLHENDLAALYVDELIDAFEAAGWEIVSPDEAYADPVATMTPVTRFTGQGRVAALSADSGRSPRTFDLWASDEARIDRMIERRGIFGPAPLDRDVP